MFLGTCKVKLDTNSMSTADQTDVKIVLKKADAEQLKGYIMKLMRQCKGEKEPVEAEAVMVWNLEAQTKDIVLHGFLSINIFFCDYCGGKFCGSSGNRYGSSQQNQHWRKPGGHTFKPYDGCGYVCFCNLGYCKRVYPVLWV